MVQGIEGQRQLFRLLHRLDLQQTTHNSFQSSWQSVYNVCDTIVKNYVKLKHLRKYKIGELQC